MRRQAGDRLIVIPMDNIGGSFPLVVRKSFGGDVMASPEWAKMVSILYALVARGEEISCVTIDTMNSTLHGEESSAEVIAQYMRALAPVTAELGAALMITHHVRKAKDDRRVSDADAMLDAIRGSAAIKDNVRVAIGIWRAPDYAKRLAMLGKPVRDKALYCAEVVKANEPMFSGTKFLLRQDSGLLDDVSRALASAVDTVALMRRVWLLFAIEEYAKQGIFFNKRGEGSGVYEMQHLLHPILQEMTRQEMLDMVNDMLRRKLIITRKVAGGSGSNKAVWFDLPDGDDEQEAAPKGSKPEAVKYEEWAYDSSSMSVEWMGPPVTGWEEQR